MKRKSVKAAALFFALALLVSLLPAPAFADPEAAAPAEAPDGYVVEPETPEEPAVYKEDPLPEPDPVILPPIGPIEPIEPPGGRDEIWIDDYAACPEIASGAAQAVSNVGEWYALRFTAPSDGCWQVLSTGEADTLVRIYDEDGYMLCEADAGGEGRNFLVLLDAAQGRTYYVFSRIARWAKGEYSVTCRRVVNARAALAEGAGPLYADFDDGERMYRYEDGQKIVSYCFSLEELDERICVEADFDDGQTERIRLADELISRKWDPYSAQEGWTPDGENILRFDVDGIPLSVTLTTVSFPAQYRGCPALAQDEPQKIVFTGVPSSGMVSFTPGEDGVWYFSSRDPVGGADPEAALFWLDENGEWEQQKWDGNSLDGVNFLLDAELKAGRTYILRTGCPGGGPGEYSVAVSRKHSFDLGFDLTGKAINLVLVVDTTGSMGDEIENVRVNLQRFVSMISDTGANLRIALIDYRDITERERTNLHYSPSDRIWYENNEVGELRDEIGRLNAIGGGDEPESAVDALGFLPDPEYLMFNSTAAKFAFLLTDASYKEENTHGLSGMEEVIGLLRERDISVSVVTAARLYGVYDKLVESTGGTRFDINQNFSQAMTAYAAQIAAKTADYVPDDTIVPVEIVTLGEDLTVPLGKVKTFIAHIEPAEATDKRLQWEVEDESVAQVSDLTKGMYLVLRGVSEGTTHIVVRSYDGGYAASFDLTVQTVVETDQNVNTADTAAMIEYLNSGGGAAGDMRDLAVDLLVSEAKSAPEADQTAIMKNIAGEDRSIRYSYEDDYGELLYSWRFNGAELTDPGIAVDMGVELGTERPAGIDTSGVGTVLASVGFRHEGALPGPADIELAVDLGDGEYALYRCDPAAGQAVKTCVVTVRDGVASFRIERGATYLIVDPEGTSAPVPGDADGDGRLTVRDAVLALAGEADPARADLTGDSRADGFDAAIILRAAVGLDE